MMRVARLWNVTYRYKFLSPSTFFIFRRLDKISTWKAKRDFLNIIIFILYSIITSLFLKVQERAMWLGAVWGGGGVYA